MLRPWSVQIIKGEARVRPVADGETEKLVARIISGVALEGDRAVRRFTLEFDKVELGKIRMSPKEIERAISRVDRETRDVIDTNLARIRKFAEFQMSMYRSMEISIDDGETTLGQTVIPVGAVGVYIPAGRYPLASSALMGIVPAKVAGVKIFVVAKTKEKNRPHPGTV